MRRLLHRVGVDVGVIVSPGVGSQTQQGFPANAKPPPSPPVMAVEPSKFKDLRGFCFSSRPRGWVANKLSGGVLIEAPSGRVLADGLCMPHSPRLLDGELYLLEAGTGCLLRIDR